MSKENVENFRQGVEAFDRGDKAEWFATFAPDAVMIPADEWPENAPVRGAEGIWDFYIDATAAWEEGFFELGEIIEAQSDTLVVNTRLEARGSSSGAAITFS